MALVKLALDNRNSSKNKKGFYPIVLSLFHKKPRLVRLGHYTSIEGWDYNNYKLKKSAIANKHINCEEVDMELTKKLFQAKELVREIGNDIDLLDISMLIAQIKEKWDHNPDSMIRKKINNRISLEEWGKVITKRKEKSNKPGTAKWYQDGIDAIKKYNNDKDIILFDLTVSFLKDFEAFHLGKGNSNNTISIYLRAVRSLYNSAIKEDRFKPLKNVFEHYRIPTGSRTKKKAVAKNKLMNIKDLQYKHGSVLWHAKNYALVMFYCRGMNFIDLVKIKVSDVSDGRLKYGRSKTGDPFSVRITEDLQKILMFYLEGEKPGDYLFPTNYDGSSKHYQKYKSQRRRMNERLKIIAKDAGIEGEFTTYYIRHSWATIAKYLGISTAIISEGLGHSSIRTTEVYLKDFDNDTLDDANELIVA